MVPEEDARVPIGNRGFLYGDGCFETIRLHRGAPFRLEAHLARLQGSLELLRFESGWSQDDLLQGMRKVVEANRVDDGLARITLTAGERPTARGTATISTRTLPEISSAPGLHVSTHTRRLSGPLSQCKSISRVAESVALREATEEGAFDAILLNENGRVAETTSRNVFIVTNGTLTTPPTYEGALAGVTRAAVLEIARNEKIRAKEVSLSLERLQSADEVVLTGSGIGVLGIASVDGHRFQTPGPITQRLKAAYESALEADSRW